ncbi:MAG: glycosyltransferase [Verrucomicrobiota bacterium]
MENNESQVALIIPCLNESDLIEQTLEAVADLDPPPSEILLVDGGSADATVEIVERYFKANPQLQGRVLISSKANRGFQLNLGASESNAEIFCFLHADTLPPPNLIDLVRRTLADPRVAVCGTRSRYMVNGRRERCITISNIGKTYIIPLIFFPWLFWRHGFRLFYGDQLISCRRSVWEAAGGIPETLMMEDAEFCLRIARLGLGKGKLIFAAAKTSGRRCESWGFWRTCFTYYALTILWAARIPVERWAAWYQETATCQAETEKH